MPTVKELRQELASLGLTIHGHEATLEARLRATKAAEQCTESSLAFLNQSHTSPGVLLAKDHPGLVQPAVWNKQPNRSRTDEQFDELWEKTKTYFPATTAGG